MPVFRANGLGEPKEFLWRENRISGLPLRSLLRHPPPLYVSARLATLDWYERVALSRRKRAIRAFDAARRRRPNKV